MERILLKSSSSGDEDVTTSIVNNYQETKDLFSTHTVDPKDIKFEKATVESIRHISKYQLSQILIHMIDAPRDTTGNIICDQSVLFFSCFCFSF